MTDPQLDEATLRAYFDETLEIFGTERVMIGTDWPVCLLRIGSYQAWTDMVRGFVARLSPDEAEAILDDNAVRIYDLRTVIDRILAKRIIPVVVLDSVESAEPLAEALLAGGLDIMEITFRTPAAEESIRRIASRFPEILVGAGTLLEPHQIVRAKNAGAVFGLAPGLNPQVVAAAQTVGLQFLPGVMTPSDVDLALSLGCRLLKFFPAEAAGGVNMLKAMAGPYAHTGVKFIPTGGVSAANLAAYLKLPVVAAIGGSWMVEKQLVNDRKWADITRLTRDALAAAAGVGAGVGV